MNNLYRYYSSDIYCMNNLISEDMLSMLHWAAQKWLVCSNVRNALAEWFCQAIHSIHERSPNLVDMKKISEICVEMNQWTVKKWSHTASLQDGICCNMQSSQYLVWPGFFGSRTNTSISPQRKSKTKLHESWNLIECLRIISGKCHVLPMMNLSIFFLVHSEELHLRMSRYKVLDPSMILQHPAVCPSTFLKKHPKMATFKTLRL